MISSMQPQFFVSCVPAASCPRDHRDLVPRRVGGMTRTVPKGSGVAGNNLRVVISVEKQAVRGSSFALSNLLLMSGAASESE